MEERKKTLALVSVLDRGRPVCLKETPAGAEPASCALLGSVVGGEDGREGRSAPQSEQGYDVTIVFYRRVGCFVSLGTFSPPADMFLLLMF